MPNNRLLAKEEVATYSGMLLDAALEQGGAERVLEVREQLDFVLRTYRDNADLREALGNPAYSPEQRHTLAVNVFDGIDPLAVSVIAVMAERGDLDKLSSTVNAYRNAAEEKLGVAVVDVTTVVALDDHLREVIKKKAEADLGTNVVLRESIDKSLIGGILMSANGKRIDASMTSQLEAARNVLKQTTDGGEC